MKLKDQGVGYNKTYTLLLDLPYNSQTQSPVYFIDVLAAAYADCEVSMQNLRKFCNYKGYTLKIDKKDEK